jgi:hypothetical protein
MQFSESKNKDSMQGRQQRQRRKESFTNNFSNLHLQYNFSPSKKKGGSRKLIILIGPKIWKITDQDHRQIKDKLA